MGALLGVGPAHREAVDLDKAAGLQAAHRPPHGGTLRIARRFDVVDDARETGDGEGETTLALEDDEVLSSAPAPSGGNDAPGPRVAVSLRVRLRDAVYLAAAQSFAREVRVLPRAASDRRRGSAGLRVGSGL